MGYYKLDKTGDEIRKAVDEVNQNKVVKYIEQNASEEEKEQARENAGIASKEEVSEIKEKFLDNYEVKEVSGAVVSFNDGTNLPVVDLTAQIIAKQASAILPVEYQQVEYVAGTDGNQYLNLGLTDTNGYTAIVDFQVEGTLPTGTDQVRICGGVTEGSPNKTNLCLRVLSGSVSLATGGTGVTGATATNDRTRVSIGGIAGQTAYLDEYTGSVATKSTTSNTSIALFGQLGDNGELREHTDNPLRVYSAKFSDSTGTLVRNLVPCYRLADSVIGMYDIVNDVFYTNQGSGSFMKGAIITLPINGWSECNVTRLGKNLFDPQLLIDAGYTISGGKYYGKASNRLSLSGIFKENTQYFISYRGYNATSSSSNFRLRINYTDGTSQQLQPNINSQDDKLYSMISSVGKTILSIDRSYSSGQYIYIYDIMIAENSSINQYEEFNKTIYTINFGQTVYGGMLDITSGVLTITHKQGDYGNLSWNKISSYANPFFSGIAPSDIYADTSGTYVVKKGLSEAYKWYTQHGASQNYWSNIKNGEWLYTSKGVSSGNRVYVRNDEYTTASAFKTAMDGIKYTYLLATPLTIQLTPTQIKTLLGNNTISADTGNISLKYLANPFNLTVNGSYIFGYINGKYSLINR